MTPPSPLPPSPLPRAHRRHVRGLRGAALFIAIVFIAGACASRPGDRYLDAVSAGQRAEHSGRYDEAARAYERAAGLATRIKDRDEAHFMQARVYQRTERWDDALRTYQRLVAESPRGDRAARAEFEAAYVLIDHGDTERGYAALLEAARHHPESGIAPHAVHRLVEHAVDKGGDAAAAAWLSRQAPAFRGTELDQVFAYETGRELEAAGQSRAAHDAFLATAKAHPYPHGDLTDDAYWHAAEIDEHDRRFAEAIEHLRSLLSSRESSSFVGSYNLARYSQAQLKIAEIYRDGLGDHRAARRAFHRLYTDHPTSILRDDALWSEASLAAADGDHSEACQLVTTLVREFSDSRYVPCANALCPNLPKPQTRRECADYIVRNLKSP